MSAERWERNAFVSVGYHWLAVDTKTEPCAFFSVNGRLSLLRRCRYIGGSWLCEKHRNNGEVGRITLFSQTIPIENMHEVVFLNNTITNSHIMCKHALKTLLPCLLNVSQVDKVKAEPTIPKLPRRSRWGRVGAGESRPNTLDLLKAPGLTPNVVGRQ